MDVGDETDAVSGGGIGGEGDGGGASYVRDDEQTEVFGTGAPGSASSGRKKRRQVRFADDVIGRDGDDVVGKAAAERMRRQRSWGATVSTSALCVGVLALVAVLFPRYFSHMVRFYHQAVRDIADNPAVMGSLDKLAALFMLLCICWIVGGVMRVIATMIRFS